MKDIKYLVLALLLFASCSKDGSSENSDFIKIPESINFFSDNFSQSSEIVFVKGEEEISMSVTTVYKIEEHKVNGEIRKMEDKVIILNYGDPSIYNIYLNLTGQFVSGTNDVNPYISISTMIPQSSGMYTGINLLSINGEHPVFSYYEDKKIGDKTFLNVYAFEYEDRSAFSTLYFTSKEGVVGFTDENDEMWVYDRTIL